MNVLLSLLVILANLFLTGLPQPLLAQAGGVAISAVVPQTATNTTFSYTAGGSTTLTNTNNTTVVFSFPTNFYSEDLRLQANSYANNFFTTDKPAVSGKSFVGKTYDFSLSTVATGSQVSIIPTAVTLTINYLDADVSGLDENALVPYRWGASDTSWQLISGATIDTANNKVTFSTTHFSAFALLATPAPAPSGGGGGGGGAGSSSPPPTSVTFSGRAYPLSSVTLLKDAQVASTTVAGQDARFTITITGLTTGNYIFSLYTEDNTGYHSGAFTFPVSVTQGASTTVGGIFLAPTVRVDKTEVKRGEPINIFGQVAPLSELTITVNSDQEFFVKTVADNSGAYLYAFDTTPLEFGQHLTKSKAVLDNEISPSSRAVAFTVGTKTVVVQPTTPAASKSDVNGDSRINLIDFSIAAYWYRRPSPPANVDLNSDGTVDLVDFSIMAYYWTG